MSAYNNKTLKTFVQILKEAALLIKAHPLKFLFYCLLAILIEYIHFKFEVWEPGIKFFLVELLNAIVVNFLCLSFVFTFQNCIERQDVFVFLNIKKSFYALVIFTISTTRLFFYALILLPVGGYGLYYLFSRMMAPYYELINPGNAFTLKKKDYFETCNTFFKHQKLQVFILGLLSLVLTFLNIWNIICLNIFFYFFILISIIVYCNEIKKHKPQAETSVNH